MTIAVDLGRKATRLTNKQTNNVDVRSAKVQISLGLSSV